MLFKHYADFKFLKNLFLIFIGFFVFPLNAQFYEYTHPELEWQSFDTEHFTFHFHQGTRRTAFTAAKIIEDLLRA